MSQTSEVPVSRCQTCGYKMDRASSVFEEASPREGDLSVCLNCGAASVFDEKGNLVPLTVEQLKNIEIKWPQSYKELKAAQRVILEHIKKN